MSSPDKVTVDSREREIYRLLGQRGDDGADVRDIFSTISVELSDTVTEQAYRKILDRLVATGRIDLLTSADDRKKRYVLAPHLHAGNALTLDDVHELLDTLAPSEAIARLTAARDYYDTHRADTINAAAKRLLDENPRLLVENFLVYLVDVLNADVAVLRDGDLRDSAMEARVVTRVRELKQLAHRYLGLTRDALEIPSNLASATATSTVHLDPDQLALQLGRRVFGDTAIRLVDATDVDGADWERITVAGTDGSSHASILRLTNPAAFADDVGSQIVTFNNSVAVIKPAPVLRNRIREPFAGVPMTRSALDDKSNRGMVMAPFMYRYLSPSEYEHTAKAATDVVQWRIDLDVFSGTARSMGSGDALPQPQVHFRYGTVTLQEREWGHYRRDNEYGDVVREGVRCSRRILERIITSSGQRPVFAGAVKSSQTHFFSSLLNWYIAHGSGTDKLQPIDRSWDTVRAAHIGDNDAMSLLLSTLQTKDTPKGSFYVSFVVMRTFGSTTEFSERVQTDEPQEWTKLFQAKQRTDQTAFDSGDEVDPPYLLTVSNIADEDFVWMCRNADYFSFYVGHTGGSPPPSIPRYEFLESTRSTEPEAVAERVRANVDAIVTAVHRTGLSEDRVGGFQRARPSARIVPLVLFEAHEKGKAVGQLLEDRLRATVVENLHRIRGAALKASDVELRPQSIRAFVQRYKATLPDDEQSGD